MYLFRNSYKLLFNEGPSSPIPNNNVSNENENPNSSSSTPIDTEEAISKTLIKETVVPSSIAVVMSKDAEEPKKDVKDIGNLYYSDVVPWNPQGGKELHEFYQRLLTSILEFVDKTNDRNEKILDFQHPAQLMEIMDFSIPDEPQNLDQLLKDCQDTLKYQVKTGHPYFFNQLSCGLDTISLAGEFITATANTNMFTYEIAPVFILMENFILKKMREIIGFHLGDSILAPGGSISNLYAIIVARHCMFPDYKKHGLRALPKGLVMYTSEHCHYSIQSAAMVSGLGTENCVRVPCDSRGKMIASELEKLVIKAKEEGKHPYFVCATAGTTVFGAFDPINELADICEKHDLWLHIDGAWGASILLSKKYRQGRFDGIERARSISWNPHKLMTTSLQCSTVHFRERGLLASCNSLNADYLFQQDKHYDVRYDTGDKVIQCGRHNDIYKLWLQWRAHGTSGFEKDIDHMMGIQEYMVERLKSMPEKFHLIVEEPECTNVCFWYIPNRFRHMPHSAQKEQILGELTPTIKQRMMNAGTLMIAYQPQGKIPNFFRNIISNPAVKTYDIDFLIAEIDRLGHDL